MLASMAKTTGTKAGTKRTGKAATKAPEGRKKSKLTLAREEGSRLAGRTLLLGTCEATGWNLSRVAEVLELASNADVIRALNELAPEEYVKAQEAGLIKKGRGPASKD